LLILDFDLLGFFPAARAARQRLEVTPGKMQAGYLLFAYCAPPRTWCSGCRDTHSRTHAQVRRPAAKQVKDAEGEFANVAVFSGVSGST
jgi:hypothetical protein